MGLFDFIFKKTKAKGEKPERSPTDWKVSKDTKLSAEVSAGMKMLRDTDSNKPPTHQQLKKAKSFGISVPEGATYDQLRKLLEKALLDQPATPEQMTLCERVGIPFQANATRGQVDELIAKAKSNRKFQAAFQRLEDEKQREHQEQYDREMREQYGDELMNEFYKWEKIENDSRNQFLIVFKRGKSVVVEIAEFNSGPEIIDGKKPYVSISLLTPIKETIDKGEYSLTWEKEVQIRSENILHFQILTTDLYPSWGSGGYESEDLLAYKRVIAQGQEIAKRFDLS